jgi:hypothetical protein
MAATATASQSRFWVVEGMRAIVSPSRAFASSHRTRHRC